MPSYKLHYFNARGRAEPTRLMFAYANVPYEDIRIPRENWPELKPKLAGNDDFEAAICDAYVDGIDDVVNALRPFIVEQDHEKKKAIWLDLEENVMKPFLARYERFLANNGTGYFVGNQLTWADIYIFDLATTLSARNPSFLDGHTSMVSFIENISGMPGIKEWMENRPKTEM